MAQSDKAKEALKELEDFLNNYSKSELPDKTELPDNGRYERLDYEEPDLDKISSSAERELSSFKNQGEKAVESEIEELNKKLISDKETAAAKADETKRELLKVYETASKNLSDDALKRGLARSSVALLSKEKLETESADKQSRLTESVNKAIAGLDSEINSLSLKREQALNDFNISYAAKLTERINELKSDAEKKKQEAVKYNNTLSEKEYGEAVNKTMKESDLYSEALKQKQTEREIAGDTSKSAGPILAKMREVLDSMSAPDARKALADNPVFREHLGDYYYYLLYNEYSR